MCGPRAFIRGHSSTRRRNSTGATGPARTQGAEAGGAGGIGPRARGAGGGPGSRDRGREDRGGGAGRVAAGGLVRRGRYGWRREVKLDNIAALAAEHEQLARTSE